MTGPHEARIMVLEQTTHNHGNRLDDHASQLKSVLEWKAAIQESTEVNRRMVEVGEGLLTALGWVGTASKWVATVGAALGALWVGFKSMMALGLK